MNMLKSGYIMVDGTGMVLSTGGTVTGLYKKLQGAIATGKLVLIENAKYGTSSAKYSPIPSVLTQGSDVIYIDTPIGGYNVTSSDVLAANA